VPNNTINSDSEKRGSFVAPLFTAGYGERYPPEERNVGLEFEWLLTMEE
jgi:hypothetical protein